MLNFEYHNHPAVNQSSLNELADSPWRYYMMHLNPKRPEKEPTKDMQIGTAIHMAILEPKIFSRTYIQGPDCRRGTKEWDKFQRDNNDKVILKPDEYEDIICSRDAILNDPIARALLKDAQFEQSFFWQDPDTGIQCKCRPDALNNSICDIKKTKSVKLRDFQNSAASYEYFIQAPFYMDGVFHATRKEVDSFIFICVEDKYPYETACFMYDEDDIHYGREEYKRLLSLLKSCKQSNMWPKFNQEIRQLKIPEWKKIR